jgi:hypothetical protein
MDGATIAKRKGPGAVPAALMLAFLVGAGHGVYDRWRMPAPPAPPKASKADIAGTIGKLDLPARRKAIAGAWVVRNSDGGGFASDYTQPMAILIDAKSDQVTIWDGREQRTARLRLDGPCSLSLMEHDKESGGESGPNYAMLVHDGVAQIGGIEDAGERVGDGAVVCTGFVYVMDDDGDCARVSAFDRPDGSTETSGDRAECSFRKDDKGKPVFAYRDPSFPDKEETVPVDGWRIGRVDELDPTDPNKDLFHRYRDFVAARAAVDADAHANDPLLIARDAGGTVGDTSTVAGLVATYAADHDKLDDKIVRVAGVVVAEPGYDLHVLATPDHLAKPTIECGNALDTLSIGTPVLVEGKVRSGDARWTRRPFAAPDLDDCKLITP